MIDWTIDWNQLLVLLIFPAGALATGLVVYALNMRQERKWAEDRRRQHSPAE